MILAEFQVVAVADITVLNQRDGDFGFIDTKRKKMKGKRKLECELTIRDGQVVYDLNGIAAPLWDK